MPECCTLVCFTATACQYTHLHSCTPNAYPSCHICRLLKRAPMSLSLPSLSVFLHSVWWSSLQSSDTLWVICIYKLENHLITFWEYFSLRNWAQKWRWYLDTCWSVEHSGVRYYREVRQTLVFVCPQIPWCNATWDSVCCVWNTTENDRGSGLGHDSCNDIRSPAISISIAYWHNHSESINTTTWVAI